MLEIADAIDAGRLISFTKELIRTPSLSKEEKEISRIIQAEMIRLDYDVVFSDELHNVVGIIKGGGGPSLMFNGHIDHAGVGRMPDPFSAKELDGDEFGHEGPVIYGRGASDMKAAVAAMVQAGGVVKRLGVPLAGDLIVTCVVREEMARGEGIKALLDAGVRADFAVSGEASGLEVYLGHRGKTEIAVTTLGQTTHAANPAGGVNAILKMNSFLNALQEDYPLPSHDFLGDATWTVLDIEASPGALTPIVPDRCRAVFDRRFLPQETREELLAGFQDVIDRLSAADPEFKAEMEMLKWFPAMFTEPENPVVQAALKARSKVLGGEGQVGSWYFGVDGTFLNEAGIPCVGFGPGNEFLAHTPEDVVPIEHLAPACQVYVQMALDMCGK
jgi:putative selenium metabolism hydrolase